MRNGLSAVVPVVAEVVVKATRWSCYYEFMIKLAEKNKKRVRAGLELLCEETTSLDKICKAATMLSRISPEMDGKLGKISEIAQKLKAVSEGDVIGLSAEKLPEKTKLQRKRKKLMLMLLTHTKDLKSEVERINAAKTAVGGGKILATMKGPLGLVTIGAAAIVAVGAWLSSISVEVNVKNLGCRPVQPIIEQRVDIPGLKLPAEAIGSGESDVVKIPGLTMKVEIVGGKVNLEVMGKTKSYALPGEIRDVIFDGQTLMGSSRIIELGKAKKHELILVCGRG